VIRTALIAAALAAGPPEKVGPNGYDPVCDGRQATQAELFENRVRELMYWRRSMGMPSSRAHIVALMRSKAAYERSDKLDSGLDGPVTAAEARYLKARAEIDPYELTKGYFKGERRAIYNGVGVADDWPRDPKLAVSVTRDVAKVRRDLTRRTHGTVGIEVSRSRFSLRELQRKQNRIDWKALAKEGIEVESSGIGEDEVHVDAFSTRPDAKRVIERRYGPGVKATIFAPLPPAEVCVAASSYLPSPDGLRLTVSGSGDLTGPVARTVLSETPTTVSVGVVLLVDFRNQGQLEGPPFTAEVQLASPIGARQVLDGETGEPLSLRQSSASAE
jgi:hypothetical protein